MLMGRLVPADSDWGVPFVYLQVMFHLKAMLSI